MERRLLEQELAGKVSALRRLITHPTGRWSESGVHVAGCDHGLGWASTGARHPAPSPVPSGRLL